MGKIDDGALVALRHQGDPEADALASFYLDRPPSDMFSGVLAARYGGTSLVDAHVAEWIDARPELPDWADARRLKRGSEFFADFAVELGVGLFLSSLPLAYASHDGVQVLALTSRLETDTKRRVLESAQFVLDVVDEHGLEPRAQGYESARSVRLMHAGIRHLIEDDGRIPITSDDIWPRWDPNWGTPINQEHLIGAMISYSSSLLKVLDKLDIDYDDGAAADYCHLWNVVGWLLGIEPGLLPMERDELDELEVLIRERNEKPSVAGTEMTEALIELVQSFVPFPLFRGFPVTIMRFFIGDETADLLGVPPADWTRHVAGQLRDVARKVSIASAENWLLRFAVRRMTKLALLGFVEHERKGDRPAFVIPDRLTPMKRSPMRPIKRLRQRVRRTAPADPA
jgi:hypothetical protein